MGALRDRMIEEMKLRNFSTATQESYVYYYRGSVLYGLLPKREFYWGKIQIGRFSTNKLVVRRNSHEKTLRAPNGIGLSEYCPLFL